ncbi:MULTISPECIES: DUF4262 domain-containing protein [unclassified Micromonospora]|uniref:DUF4262 domain-containing protein n=1 Tax=unclassified Micromonospora TaxID=2617518 RepID=UPI001C22A8A2|nr:MULTISPECIES: DUF4262 domain-containing protein [unclassified Micromonospora]MBU8857771.1 DUF4262 domain-containing protein [Micromonospora sp. WMMB482]MDM4783400.1 DUF4262 domain-containing protein [Micromonospora sp. b486]
MPNTDDFLQRQDRIIDTIGWAVTYVLPTDDDPDTTAPFAYTVGLTAHDYPELITAGLPPEVAHSLLNDLARRVDDKAERFTHGQRISDLIAGYDAIIIDGPPTDDLLPGLAISRYGRDQIRLQQLVWPDQQARFPWDHGYNVAPQAQPLIAKL